MRHQYPNPDAVPYTSTQPAGFPCQLTTQDPGRMYPVHNHGAFLREDGNGNTDVAAGHFHRVVNFRVQADPSDGHTHEMTMLPCGVGAPHTTGRNGPIQALQPGLNGLGDLAPTPTALPPTRPGFSVWPWVVGAVVVSGLVIGGVLLMRSEA